MEQTYKRWRKHLDQFDGAIDALPSLEQEMRLWNPFAPAVPALFDALIRERAAYKATAHELRSWMDSQPKDLGEPEEFGKRLRSSIDAARRLKGLIDALDREKSIAEAAYPEMAGGSLKDSGALAAGAPVESGKVADYVRNGSSPETRPREPPGNRNGLG